MGTAIFAFPGDTTNAVVHALPHPQFRLRCVAHVVAPGYLGPESINVEGDIECYC
jgi:hypothetical protein